MMGAILTKFGRAPTTATILMTPLPRPGGSRYRAHPEPVETGSPTAGGGACVPSVTCSASAAAGRAVRSGDEAGPDPSPLDGGRPSRAAAPPPAGGGAHRAAPD